ncbi:hypothetical protein F4009_20310 [Candidatus Poribacteria bacterium]|nr:hypothetical protein [Candidatus Poribacteria bacterium]MYH81998.1 hypothetical protein [Candidatus Poribacteria bacterium]MYK96309.1 hypothetical protein [Candidatus Poribacteria bacterium]
MPNPKWEKRIVDFEMRYCCSYDPDELDKSIAGEFTKTFLETRGAQSGDSTEDVLYQIGALIKDEENGKYAFTNAGYLFFASNPLKRFANAFVRVLKYDTCDKDLASKVDTILDKDFDGALPNVIRNLRTFLKTSGPFQILDDPKYPSISVDEALVNAVIHRDYAVNIPIRCTVYKDKVVVKNPGGILQTVPRHFNVGDTTLPSVLRNPRIVEWMRLMKNGHGGTLVRALSEGTRKMRQEMENLGLPAPNYETSQHTSVTLYNHFEERLAPHAAYTTTSKPETPSEQGSVKKALCSIGERLAKIE